MISHKTVIDYVRISFLLSLISGGKLLVIHKRTPATVIRISEKLQFASVQREISLC